VLSAEKKKIFLPRIARHEKEESEPSGQEGEGKVLSDWYRISSSSLLSLMSFAEEDY
jgi:hypothetical protein